MHEKIFKKSCKTIDLKYQLKDLCQYCRDLQPSDQNGAIADFIADDNNSVLSKIFKKSLEK